MVIQTRKLAQCFFWISWMILGILCTYILFFLWLNGYHEFTHQILNSPQSIEKLNTLKTKFLTPNVFLVLKSLSIFTLAGWGIILFFRQKIQLLFLFFFKELRIILKQEIKFIQNLSQFQKVTLVITFIVLSMIRIISSYYFPIQEDEVFTYVYFIHPGFLVSASYYPGPNNHVFYSLITCLLKPFITHPLWLLRTPVILISLVNTYLVFRILKYYYDYISALLGILIFSFLPFIFFYSFLGRGYAWQLFFLLFALALQLSDKQHTLFYRLIWILSCTLGFYTIPTFLYLFSGLFFLRFWKRESLKKVFLDGFIVFLLVLVLYTPIFLFNRDSFLYNDWVKAIEWKIFLHQFSYYWLELFDDLLHLKNSFLGILGMAIFLIYIRIFQKKKAQFSGIQNLLVFILFGILWTLIQQVLPPTRVWMYLSFFFVWALWEIISLSKWKHLILLGTTLYFIQATSTTFYYLDKKGGNFREVSKQIIQSNPIDIYTNSSTYFIFLQYETLEQKHSTIITDKYIPHKTPELLIVKNDTKEIFNLTQYQIEYLDEQITVYRLSTNL